MAKFCTEIDDRITEWMANQQLFFVSTAPLDAEGLVNCSPKGMDTLRVLGPKKIAYLDLDGSGIETVAHLKENARIVIMMCAFEGIPKIFRFHGHGSVVEPHHASFESLLGEFPPQPACRSIIMIDLVRVADSCGYAVPLYEHKAPRDALTKWVENKSSEELHEYRNQHNTKSIGSLPGLEP